MHLFNAIITMVRLKMLIVSETCIHKRRLSFAELLQAIAKRQHTKNKSEKTGLLVIKGVKLKPTF